MKKLQIAFRALLLAVFAFTFSSLTQAQATRTWVSGVGDDVNPCSRTAPCKTFSGAITKTAAYGEISVLDPAGYGVVTITKSITINGEGTLASILNNGISGVVVNAATTDVVVLRNIQINGGGAGLNGIRILAAKSVQVDHCLINGQTGDGIRVVATNNVTVNVIDTVIEDCAVDGIYASTTTGEVLLSVDNTRIHNCDSVGIEAVDNVRGAIRNSFVTDNTSAGIQTTGTNNQLNVDRVFVSYSTVGLQASAGSNIRLSDSVIAQNITGINANGGTIDSFQGNSLIGNTTPGVFTTTTAKQ